MSTRLRFILDGDDHLSPVLNTAGDSSARLHRRLNDDMRGNTTAVRGFTQDANGRLRDLQGRFLSVADAQRAMAGGLPDLTRSLGSVAGAGSSAAASLGASGGGLSGVMAGVAAVAGLSLLPALGALVPMMAGAGVAAGTLKLGFAGVGDALEAAGKGKEEYAEALKKLSPPARDFTKALVGLKKEFSGVGKEVQKAMLPGFTQAVKSAGPVVKILGQSMTEMGRAFGDAAAGVGRMVKDSGFQGLFQDNLRLGVGFVRDMTRSMGPFVQSLLDFGAASGPTLKAFSDGLGGLLSRGLPGMFDGLKTGIGGAAQFLDGLFDSVNTVLPALGRLSGAVAAAFGPILGETFRLLGDQTANAMDALAGGLKLLQPLFRDAAYGLKTINDVTRIIGPTLKDTGLAILGAFAPIGSAVNGTVGPLQRLNTWVNNNKGSILEMARIMGGAMIDMTGAVISSVPTITGAFKTMAVLALDGVGAMISGLAKAFGHVPILGDKLKGAAEDFNTFKGKFIGGLTTAQQKAETFAREAAPRLASGKLKLNINNWEQQITAAKAQMKSVPPEKRAALKAHIADLEAKVKAAKGQLASVKDKNTTVRALDRASGVIGGILGMLSSVNGRTANTYVVTHYQAKYDNAAAKPFRRNGGHAPKFAAGGMPSGLLSGPGTGTSDSIPMWWAGDGEYVVNARSTAKYRNLIEAINADTLGTGGASRGGSRKGSTAESGKAAGQGLITGMGQATSDVGRAAMLMSSAITAGIKEEMQIASPSKKTKALAADIGKGLIVGLTGTQSKIKAVAADLVKDIKTAFSGKKESQLVAYVNRQTKMLLGLAAKRDKIAATIAAAKKYASDTTAAAKENAGLANLGIEDGKVTAGTIKAGLASKLSQLKQFTTYIAQLAKKGLNRGLLRQIINMGPEQGYAYASALMGADKATLASINSLDAQLGKSADALGKTGADALYDSGANASKGFLAGLTSQQKALEKTMEKIAKAMQKALRKALGIKSPARAMIPDGRMIASGVAVGVHEGIPEVDRAVVAMSRRLPGRIANRVQPGRTAVGAAHGAVYQVHVEVKEAMDPVAVATKVQQMLLHLGRAQGAPVSLQLGGVSA